MLIKKVIIFSLTGGSKEFIFVIISSVSFLIKFVFLIIEFVYIFVTNSCTSSSYESR